jgi:histidinol-phosphatase (PHP family)
MIRSNYHVHSDYCDGNNTLEEMVQAGIDAGLESMGLSSHMPLPFPNNWTMQIENIEKYLSEIIRLKEKYKRDIEIYTGLEVDYFIDRMDISGDAKKILPQLDYVIMSIHTIGSTIGEKVSYIDDSQKDFELGIKKYYDHDPRLFIETYYNGIAKMVNDQKPTLLGHFDLIKKYNHNNFFFDDTEKWYRESVRKCLDRIADTKTIVEVNTGANMRVPGVGRYPSDWIIPELYKRDIPITVTGDTHTVDGIINEYKEAEAFLIASGYKEYAILRKGHWKFEKLGY